MKEKKAINLKTIFDFSSKILFRNWKKFFLPFVSLVLTSAIVLIVLLFTASAGNFLDDKNKELIGGDFSIDTNYPLKSEIIEEIKNNTNFEKFSVDYHFSGIVNSLNKESFTSVSLYVIDSNYPLYGELLFNQGDFVYPKKDEILISDKVSKDLNVSLGESVIYTNNIYKVAGIVKQDARALFSGFGFLPKVFISEEGFVSSGIDSNLLRLEYKYTFKIQNDLNTTQKDFLFSLTDRLGVSVEIAGVSRIGFLEGLSLVRQFLVLVILLCVVLSAVNIYASVLYLINLMKKSFAVLISLGFKKRDLVLTLSLSLFYVLVLAFILGVILAFIIFNILSIFVFQEFEIVLPLNSLFSPILIAFVVTFFTAFASFVPTLRLFSSLTPKMLLSLKEDKNENFFKNIFFITLYTLLPLMGIAIFLLENILYGFISVLIILLFYLLLSSFFYFITKFFYKIREKMNFLFSTLVSQKLSDGIFGIVSFTSLYVALSSLFLIILLQATLVNFLDRDLGDRLPSLYLIDIQKSQVANLKNNYTDLNLFPNVRARIISIDGKDIQASLAKGDESVDRELGREYNLTYRNDLISSEKVVSGKWFGENLGEASVEKDFAKRAGIELGSNVVFSVSGFEIPVKITSIREVDSRSGLPFFFFVLGEKDLSSFPSTFFGYSYIDEKEEISLANFLATNYPNISLINTREVANLVGDLVSVMLLIVFIVSLPPLFLALFLILNLVISVFASRQKQNAQLLALGSKRSFLKKLYFLETLSTSIISGILGCLTAMAGVIFLAKFYLKIKSYKIFDIEILLFFFIVLLFVLLVAFFLWKSNKKPIRELLSNEEL